MKIEPPLHAEHQLDQLAGQFEHWRQTRTHPSERFQALWDQAGLGHSYASRAWPNSYGCVSST